MKEEEMERGLQLQGSREEGVRQLDGERQRRWVLLLERVRKEQFEERATVRVSTVEGGGSTSRREGERELLFKRNRHV
jgi:hypothetical protein